MHTHSPIATRPQARLARPKAPGRRALWPLALLVLIVHLVLLAWWQRRETHVVDATPNAPTATIANATTKATFQTVALVNPPAAAPPSVDMPIAAEVRVAPPVVKEAAKSHPPARTEILPGPMHQKAGTPAAPRKTADHQTAAPRTEPAPHGSDESAPAVTALPTQSAQQAEMVASATIGTGEAPPSPDAKSEPAHTTPSGSPAKPAAAPPLIIPASKVLEYDVTASRKGLSFHAEGTLSWQTSAGGYEARTDIKALFVGTRTQTSVGTIDPKLGLQPRRFGDKNRSELAAHFDRTESPPVIRFSANTPDAPLHPQSQDRLSVLMQLAAMLGGAPKSIRPGLAMTLHTAGARDAEDWRFTVEAVEALDLPAGRMEAVHLLRMPSQPYDNRVEVWMAPALGYLPVRILWTQANGDVVDQRLTGHTP
jgi:hypothetical protein